MASKWQQVVKGKRVGGPEFSSERKEKRGKVCPGEGVSAKCQCEGIGNRTRFGREGAEDAKEGQSW